MIVKIYTIFLLVYIFLILNRLAVKDDPKEFMMIGLGFMVWLPIIGRVFDLW
jgi:hypothetical protein